MTLRLPDTCPICLAGYEGLKWTEKYVRGECTLKDMSMHFKVPLSTVKEHIQNHNIASRIKQRLDKLGESIERGEYLSHFKMILYSLLEQLEYINAGGELTDKRINSLVKLADTARKCLMDIAEFEGKIKQKTIEINIQQQKEELKMIEDILLNDLCNKCQSKVLHKMESFTYI